MADIKWIKITTDIFNDEKLLMIEDMPDADSVIVIWFKLLCLAGRDNNNGILIMNNKIPYTEEMLASIFRRPLNTVRLALAEFEKYGMIETYDGIMTIPNWDKHQNIEGMEKIKEQTRVRVAKHRERQKMLVCNATCNATVTQCNATDKEEEKEKKKKKNNKENSKELFLRLRCDYNFSDVVEEKILEWIEYKTERKEGYVEQGLKSLLRKLENSAFNFGEDALMQVIDDSMSNGYKGIIFDKLTKQQVKAGSYQDKVQNRMSVVDNW